MGRLRRRWIALIIVLGLSGWAGAAHADLSQGDLAWSERAVQLSGELAQPDRIEAAIAQYRRALEADPASAVARWKLLRALHYAIDFSSLPDDLKEERVAEAVELARTSAGLAEELQASGRDRARLLFWSAIAWGVRAQRVGLLTVVREGAATRMHDFAQDSLELDPGVDRGGAYRLLSRLHATLPRVPFVSGWVDPDKALPLAEKGYSLAPEHPGNRLILALSLIEAEAAAPADRTRAAALLRSVAEADPRPGFRAEDLRIRKQARIRLAALVQEDA